jgi:hypothetical protein
VVLDFNRYGRYFDEKYLSRLRPRMPPSAAEETNSRSRNNAYPGFLAPEEDRCSYLLQQHFCTDDSRGPPVKQLELHSYVSLVPLMHRHAQDGKVRTQWTVWEDGFLEWVSLQKSIPSAISGSHDFFSHLWSSRCGIFSRETVQFQDLVAHFHGDAQYRRVASPHPSI